MKMAALRNAWADRLPQVKGKLDFDAPLAPFNWFRVGGLADVLFRPADVADLSRFLVHLDADVPVTVIGVGSNLLVRDDGIEGVVIRLGAGFNTIAGHPEQIVSAGAGALDVHVAAFARDAGVAGLEFLRGVPGTIGGAVAMNAGAYGAETGDRLVSATVVMRDGVVATLARDALAMTYRRGHLPAGAIVVEASFQGMPDSPDAIGERMEKIQAQRESTQPLRAKTGGSTFKNPPGLRAWELIDQAGCRGLVIGDAEVSTVHCNFLINRGTATATDLENLGEEIRRRVLQNSGIELEWEIKRLGRLAE